MKINAFRVQPGNDSAPFATVLRAVLRTPIEDRWRLINYNELRVEDIVHRNNVWLFDTVRRRYTGPGKVAQTTPIEGFSFDDTETFGEETAALYDESLNYILIQYNHYGARSSSIAAYFSEFLADQENSFSFPVKLRDDSERRLARKTLFRRLNVGLDLSRLAIHNRDAGISVGRSLKEAGEGLGATTVYVSFGLDRWDRSKNLITRSTVSAVNHFRNLLEQDDSPVSHLSISAKDNEESPTEPIDFIAERLTYTDNRVQSGDDLRVPREARYSLLRQAHGEWRTLLR